MRGIGFVEGDLVAGVEGAEFVGFASISAAEERGGGAFEVASVGDVGAADLGILGGFGVNDWEAGSGAFDLGHHEACGAEFFELDGLEEVGIRECACDFLDEGADVAFEGEVLAFARGWGMGVVGVAGGVGGNRGIGRAGVVEFEGSFGGWRGERLSEGVFSGEHHVPESAFQAFLGISQVFGRVRGLGGEIGLGVDGI